MAQYWQYFSDLQKIPGGDQTTTPGQTRTLQHKQNKMIHLWRLHTSAAPQGWLQPRKPQQATTRKSCKSFRKHYRDIIRIDKRSTTRASGFYLKLSCKIFLNAKWNLWSSIALTSSNKLLNKLHENIFYVLIESRSMTGFAVVQQSVTSWIMVH